MRQPLPTPSKRRRSARLGFTLLLPLFISLGLFAGEPATDPVETLYYTGLRYRVGEAPGWGKGLPVLTSIRPYSPAALGGLQAGDILLEVDGVATSGLSSDEVDELLRSPERQHLLTLLRIGAERLIHLLHPSSKPSTALSERELAYAFGGYSPEDQESTERVLPFTFSSNATFDWSQAKTFAFAPSSSGDKSLDDALYGRIAQLLEARGLRQQSASPDLVIQSLYTLDRSAGLHFQLQVARSGAPDDILWRAESMELAPTASTMESYAREILPLVLYAFPYIPTAERPSYRKDTRRYLYTGILYDKHDLSRIADVEDASPAFVAGLRSGDRILRIGGKALTPTSLEALSEKYRDFLSDTYKHRIQLRDGSGSHAWAQGSYGSIKKALEREKYAAVFSYLFAFRPYVDDAKTTELSFEVERDGQRYTLSIQPLLRDESTLIPQ